MKKELKRKGYTLEEMKKRMHRRIEESAKKLASRLKIIESRDSHIKVR
ncbi:MAG TPA: hypothetical protein VI937_00965 [Negativicutes bacterium]|nr:hypothetical protein [Negativicutes bacterium]